MTFLGLKKLDFYIIKKFLSTFFYSIVLIVIIAIVFDLSEKFDDFHKKDAPPNEIIKYYLNFAPYFVVLFISLFTFISVIYFTSRMAYNSEIVAIISSGISFRRLLVPYFVGAFIIGSFSFIMMNYVLPFTNKYKLQFEYTYNINRVKKENTGNDLHFQVEDDLFLYVERFREQSQTATLFTLERFKDGELTSKLVAESMKWDSTLNKWVLRNYYIRDIDGVNEVLSFGDKIDTTLAIKPEDFKRSLNIIESMTLPQLQEFIDQQKRQGNTNVVSYELEKYRRLFDPFSTFILTFIGLTVSMRKMRGGMGGQIGFGVMLSFAYILIARFTQQFSIGEGLNPVLAIWMPNFFFIFLSVFLYRMAPK